MLRLFFYTFKNFRKLIFKLIPNADIFLRHFNLAELQLQIRCIKVAQVLVTAIFSSSQPGMQMK